ncbi:MAG TPA: polysaccharide deacetylase family protein [Polyangiaceae bacterium]|nr:polysaccharide deacetylase family protein [Polyangiaceae bacterium]
MRSRRCGWALGWGPSIALVVLGCSGPDLHPTPAVEPPENLDEIEIVLPPGGRCGPQRVAAEAALVPGASSSQGDQECSSPRPNGIDEWYSPLRPLGVGYPGGPNLLPRGVAYLTFDDGPSEWTPRFLDILKEKGVKATFFVTAKQLKGVVGLDGTFIDERGNTVIYRDLLKREVDEGHQLANHTVNHADIGRITRAQLTSEIEENELLVNRALLRAGALPELLTLFRPPYGSPWFTGIAGPIDPSPTERIASYALNIMWTVTSSDASDWAVGEAYSRFSRPAIADDAPTYEEKVERVKQAVLEAPATATGDGMIVLMHDTHSVTRDVLPDIIDGLAAQGYTFETIEHYVQWRWQRPSLDLAPGPSLYNSCVPDKDWGCEAFDVPVGTDRTAEVCGRMWVAFRALGGVEELGVPVAAPERSPDTGIVSQSFERAVVELHPENPAPCNFVARPR